MKCNQLQVNDVVPNKKQTLQHYSQIQNAALLIHPIVSISNILEMFAAKQF